LLVGLHCSPASHNPGSGLKSDRNNYEQIVKTPLEPSPTGQDLAGQLSDDVSLPVPDNQRVLAGTVLSPGEDSELVTTTPTQTRQSRSPWREFGAAFLTIFLAELGDKTQLATLLMVAESRSPWVVFAGAATALVATSLVGVLVGRWLAERLSPRTLQTATGASLLLIAVLLLWDVVHL
jgi:putative Ca2+/H+ antiporter (TMEM165/GDT1 family)